MWPYVRFPPKRKRHKQLFYANFILCLIVVFSLGAVGIGYAAWHDTLKLESTLTTGSIELIFTEAYLSDTGKGWGEGQGQSPGKKVESVPIAADGKSLSIKMDNPKRGNYFLTYTIKNQGNLPVEVKTITQTCGDVLELQMLHEPEGVIEGDETARGQLKIFVEKVQEDCTVSFIVQLVFKQAPVL